MMILCFLSVSLRQSHIVIAAILQLYVVTYLGHHVPDNDNMRGFRLNRNLFIVKQKISKWLLKNFCLISLVYGFSSLQT